MLAEADRVIGEIITDDMNDVEKEFAINNYLCSTAEYDYDALDNAEENNYETVGHEFAHSFTPYGVRLNKLGIDGQWITVDSINNDNEKYANALLNIPDYMSSGFLVEDNTYLLSDALAQMEADQEVSVYMFLGVLSVEM